MARDRGVEHQRLLKKRKGPWRIATVKASKSAENLLSVISGLAMAERRQMQGSQRADGAAEHHHRP